MDFSKFKYYDETDKYIVFGFFRQTFQNINTPPVIMYICFYYFHHPEIFSYHGSFMSLNKINNILTFKHSKPSNTKYNTAYGRLHIIRIDTKYIHKWEIKLLSLDPQTDIIIGIDSSNMEHVNSNFSDNEINVVPSFYAMNRQCAGKWNTWDTKTEINSPLYWMQEKRLDAGDIITLQITSDSYNTLIIEYFVNEYEALKLKQVRITDLGYRFAIAMNGNGSVEIVRYSTTRVDQ